MNTNFHNIPSSVTRDEVLAALQQALRSATNTGGCWFNSVAPVGAVVAAHAPLPSGAVMGVSGVVVAHRPDPVTGRTVAVVVNQFGRLYPSYVTERPGLCNTYRVTEADIRAALVAVEAQ